MARNAAQLARLRRTRGGGGDLAGTPTPSCSTPPRRRPGCDVADAVGSLWHPHCATLHPAKLVAGLAAAVERLGVTIHERHHGDGDRGGPGPDPRGDVRARHVIRATEGFTPGLRGERRTVLPMNSSLVIVTEPLPAEAWERIGWHGREALGDIAHAYIYAQRTADGRIAFGGRGVPYRFGSRTDTDGATHPATIAQLTGLLRTFFPAARDAAVDHAWCGVLGVPRDWSASVGLDPRTGLGWAGGYVGDRGHRDQPRRPHAAPTWSWATTPS